MSNQTLKTIDVTPTWSAMLPVLITLLQGKNAEGREAATKELKKMAKALDNYNAHANDQNNF
jgi:hypothetical protein